MNKKWENGMKSWLMSLEDEGLLLPSAHCIHFGFLSGCPVHRTHLSFFTVSAECIVKYLCVPFFSAFTFTQQMANSAFSLTHFLLLQFLAVYCIFLAFPLYLKCLALIKIGL